MFVHKKVHKNAFYFFAKKKATPNERSDLRLLTPFNLNYSSLGISSLAIDFVIVAPSGADFNPTIFLISS